MSNIKIDNKSYQIGAKIKKAREEAGMTQSELGESIGGYSAMAVSYFEKGEREVKVDILRKIADALSQDVEYFLGDPSSDDQSSTIAASAYFRRGSYDLSNEEKKKEDQAVKNFKDYLKELKK